MSLKEKTEYLHSVLADRMEEFGRDEKFAAMMKLLEDEFNKLNTEEKVAFSLLVCSVGGGMAEEAIAEIAEKQKGN